MKKIFASLFAARETGSLFVAGAIAFASALFASAPASLLPGLLGFEKHGVRYESVEGAIWRGVFTGVSVDGIYLGDIGYRLRLIALLRGALAAHITAAGALEGSGDISIGARGTAGVKAASFDFNLGALKHYAFLGEPLRGNVRLEVERFAFSPQGCLRADVRAWSDVLEAPARRIDAPAMPLAGTISCDGDDVLASLAGDGEEGSVALALRVTPSLTYQVDATVAPTRLEMREALQSLGFRREDDRLTIGTRGAIRSAGA